MQFVIDMTKGVPRFNFKRNDLSKESPEQGGAGSPAQPVTVQASQSGPQTPLPPVSAEWDTDNIEIHRSNTPLTWTSGPLTTVELDIFQRENTLELQTIPPLPADLPLRDTTTGLTFTRIFIKEDYSALDCLDILIRKHLRNHDGLSPHVVYVHPDLYNKLCIEHFQIYRHPFANTYHTFGIFHQTIEVAVYPGNMAGIDLPREVLICQ